MSAEEWMEVVDATSGQPYLWNPTTNATRWTAAGLLGRGGNAATHAQARGGLSPYSGNPRTSTAPPSDALQRASGVSASPTEGWNYGWSSSTSENTTTYLERSMQQASLGYSSAALCAPRPAIRNPVYGNQSTPGHPYPASHPRSGPRPYPASASRSSRYPISPDSTDETGDPHASYGSQAYSSPGGSGLASRIGPPRVVRQLKAPSGPASTEPLDPEYKVRPQPAKWFKEGKVFLMLWSQSTASTQLGSDVTLGIMGQNVHSAIRRFVVIRTSNGSSACLQILTYSGQGVAKHGCQKSDHAIIYTGNIAPKPMPEELPDLGEAGMQSIPIKVTPHIQGERLDDMSRINLGKIYTVEHNLRVRGFGLVDNVDGLKLLHRAVWYKELYNPQGAVHQSARSASQQIPPSFGRTGGNTSARRNISNMQRYGFQRDYGSQPLHNAPQVVGSWQNYDQSETMQQRFLQQAVDDEEDQRIAFNQQQNEDEGDGVFVDDYDDDDNH